jgi:hypothetical protein
MADKDALINQFMEVTGVNRERAEFFINASNSQLDVSRLQKFVQHFFFD